MLNCANQTLLERIIPPPAGECCWQRALCCQTFSGIALAVKSMPKVMSPFWIQLLNYTEKRSTIKAWSPHPNWEQPAQPLLLLNPALSLPFHKWWSWEYSFKANNSPALQFPSQNLFTSKSDLQQYENFKTPTYSSLTSCLKRKWKY